MSVNKITCFCLEKGFLDGVNQTLIKKLVVAKL